MIGGASRQREGLQLALVDALSPTPGRHRHRSMVDEARVTPSAAAAWSTWLVMVVVAVLWFVEKRHALRRHGCRSLGGGGG